MMIEIKKFNDKDLLVNISGTDILNHTTTMSLGDELIHHIYPDASIVINLENIRSVEKEGYRDMANLMNYADKNNCFIKFTGVQDDINELITNLSYISDG